MDVLRRGKASGGGVEELRRIRHIVCSKYGAITSAQHWLDYLWCGNESLEPLKGISTNSYLSEAFCPPRLGGRGYSNSWFRFTLLPHGLDCATPIKELINLYDSIFRMKKRLQRDLQQFSTEFIIDYLGDIFVVG